MLRTTTLRCWQTTRPNIASSRRFFATTDAHEHSDHSYYKFTRAEVAKHDRMDDCWIIIHGKVYNVTEFIPEHPGGIVITQRAGRDSTVLFESRVHSDHAKAIMKKIPHW